MQLPIFQMPLDLAAVVPPDILQASQTYGQGAIPYMAKHPELVRQIEDAAQGIATNHHIYEGDARNLNPLPNASVHLVVTSPPYWTLKAYPVRSGQLGLVDDFDLFVFELAKVWREAYRILVPGGRLVVVVGDVCLPRRAFGRHVVFPLHAAIQEQCREIGFDNLAPIIWHKIANARFEVENGSRFLGKPYEPNGIVKNDIEFILFQRKPGGYRQPSLAARLLSVISEDKQRVWFQQIWTLGGASTRQHPAPFPLPLAERLVRMFSFVGDTVLDPFLGTGTTSVAACRWGRNSVGLDIEPHYLRLARSRIERESQGRLSVPTQLVAQEA